MCNVALQKNVKRVWDDLHFVLVVARERSLKKAAYTLHVTESTVSRHVASAERSLGYSLFERTPTGMVCTPAGARLTRSLMQAEAEIDAGIDAAASEQKTPKGIVRLTAVPKLMNYLIAPASPRLVSQFPDIEVELVGSPMYLSIMRRDVDIAIRMARPASELDVVARRVGQLEYAVYTRSSWLSESVDKVLPWINYEPNMANLPQAKWIENRVLEYGEPVSNLRCNDAESLISVLKAGMGKTLLPKAIANKIPYLIEISGYDNLPKRDIWLLVHPNVAKSKRIRVVINWLIDVFASA